MLSIEDLTKKIGFQYSKFISASEHWDAENLAAKLPSYTLREHLREAIEKLLPESTEATSRLVIFIDDVDRCEPDIAYSLLEGLKVYLTLDNCVFVLGMNRKAVADALARRFHYSMSSIHNNFISEEVSPTAMATAYMEKICQNVWQLPIVPNPQQTLFQFLTTTVSCEATRLLIHNSVTDINCLPPNPRRLKGLANTIGRFAQRLPDPANVKDNISEITRARVLVVVAYIYHFHPELYVRWEAELEFYKEIRDYCREGKSPNAAFRGLSVPKTKKVDEKTPTPEGEYNSAYPDPTDARVFWIQALVLELGTEVRPNDFSRFVRNEVTDD